MVKLTDLEKDVLRNGLYDNNFNDVTVETLKSWGSKYGDRGCIISVWSDCVVECCTVCINTQISGVLSSLSKKGLVVCEGHGRDARVEVTKEGFEEIKILL